MRIQQISDPSGNASTDVLATRGQFPRHVAIVMDGNGRWANKRHLPRHAGHRAGVEAVRCVVEQCVKKGIEVLTLFAFSSENWQRPKKEVGFLMELFFNALDREVNKLNRNNVKLRVIGDRQGFSERLRNKIAEAETLTRGNSGLWLQVAANYGGRWDITQAVRSIADEVEKGTLSASAVDSSALASRLSFPDLPDPDLLIRTGGEHRISNFMLWQTAYSELYFTDTLWPDFDALSFDTALSSFAKRQRRFGRTGDQVEFVTDGSP